MNKNEETKTKEGAAPLDLEAVNEATEKMSEAAGRMEKAINLQREMENTADVSGETEAGNESEKEESAKDYSDRVMGNRT